MFITEDEVVEFRLSGAANTDLNITLLSPNFESVGVSDEGGSTEYISHIADSSGEYYVGVEYHEGP